MTTIAHPAAMLRSHTHAHAGWQPSRLRRLAASCALGAIVLTGCGGGGDGSSDPPPPTVTHRIGGQVGGLSGTNTGLALVLNTNVETVSIAQAGPFFFPREIAHGGSYSVTVGVQPTGQVCSVTRGSGTATQAVTDILVTCVAAPPLTLVSSTPAPDAAGVPRDVVPTFTFSAALNGDTLAGNVGLRRADQNIEANNSVSNSVLSISPRVRLLPLSRYTASAGVGLRGAGGEALANGVSVNFTTADGAWQPELRLASAVTLAAAELAVDANGNAMAVWIQPDLGGSTAVWASYYSIGSGPGSPAGWSPPAPIETKSAGRSDTASPPQVKFDDAGNAMVVWARSDGNGLSSIWANRFTAAGWGTATLIETNTGDAFSPQLAVDAAGTAMAVWAQSDGTRVNVWANRYTAGTGWGSAVPIESNDTGDASFPQVAVDTNGNAIAVWQRSDGVGALINLWANRFSVGNGWGTAALIETESSGSAGQQRVAFDPFGNAIVVWSQFDGTSTNIVANRYTAGTGWGSPAVISFVRALWSSHSPQVAIDATGNALAVWHRVDTSDGRRVYSLLTSRYTAGVGWGRESLVYNSASAESGKPRLAVDPNGNGLAVSEYLSGSTMHVKVDRYESGTGWLRHEWLTDPVSNNANLKPRIAIDASGNAMALWVRQVPNADPAQPGRDEIWVRRFQ
jgi:hypothetical protein